MYVLEKLGLYEKTRIKTFGIVKGKQVRRERNNIYSLE